MKTVKTRPILWRVNIIGQYCERNLPKKLVETKTEIK